jgi:hypothetical protein
MKIKMKTSIVGAIGNGEASMEYKAGESYEMKTSLEMQMASTWLNDGKAEQPKAETQKKATEEAPQKKKRSFFGRKKK